MVQLKSEHLPIDVNGWTFEQTDLPSGVSLPVHPNDIDWSGSFPAGYENAVLKSLTDASEAQKNRWFSDAIRTAVNANYQPPNGQTAKEQIEDYLYATYSYDDALDIMDGNSSMIDAIANERYQIVDKRLDTLVQRQEITQADADEIRKILKLN